MNGRRDIAGPYISVVIPSLNEERFIGRCLDSLMKQDYPNCEVIVVDGGSQDATVEICRSCGAIAFVERGLREFPSRNLGATRAEGEIILFTGADVVFPPRVLERIAAKFAKDPDLIAVAGPGIPSQAGIPFSVEFAVYNFMRWLCAQLPGKWRRYSTSTNLLAVRKAELEQVGGLEPYNVNADGLLGAALVKRGKVHFSLWPIRVDMSARRLKAMGFIKANLHFVYVVENFLPFTSNAFFIKKRKARSAAAHSTMRELDHANTEA